MELLPINWTTSPQIILPGFSFHLRKWKDPKSNSQPHTDKQEKPCRWCEGGNSLSCSTMRLCSPVLNEEVSGRWVQLQPSTSGKVTLAFLGILEESQRNRPCREQGFKRNSRFSRISSSRLKSYACQWERNQAKRARSLLGWIKN